MTKRRKFSDQFKAKVALEPMLSRRIVERQMTLTLASKTDPISENVESCRSFRMLRRSLMSPKRLYIASQKAPEYSFMKVSDSTILGKLYTFQYPIF